ncbi:protein-L-isoaspartate(D-aspartate) O-methyltransferase [Candidatus Omnitrophota bacterium]
MMQVKRREFESLRAKMVEQQLIPRGIQDQGVLAAMRKVERHVFVTENQRGLAYEDIPLSIGHNQTISQPYIVAFMTEVLNLIGNERVLEVGAGCGYQSAILGELVAEVYSLEIIKPLVDMAHRNIARTGYMNVEIIHGDAYAGWAEKAPYDAILVAAAAPTVPEILIEQLADNGRMILPVGEGIQQLCLITKKSGEVKKTMVLPVRFVPLVREDSIQ